MKRAHENAKGHSLGEGHGRPTSYLVLCFGHLNPESSSSPGKGVHTTAVEARLAWLAFLVSIVRRSQAGCLGTGCIDPGHVVWGAIFLVRIKPGIIICQRHVTLLTYY